MNEADKGLGGGENLTGSSDAEVAAAYESVAGGSESVASTTTESSGGAPALDGIQQSARNIVLQRRAVAGMVFKQLWVILFTLVFVFMGVTFVPWSSIEDHNPAMVRAAAVENAKAMALAASGGTSDAEYQRYEVDAFAAEARKGHVAGYTSGRGGIVFFVTFWALCGCILGVFTNRFLLVPTAAAFLTNEVVCASRLLAVFKDPDIREILGQAFSGRNFDVALGVYADVFGPGFFFVMVGSLFIPIYLVFSAVSGAKKDGAKNAKQGGGGRGAKKPTSGGRKGRK